MVSHSHEDLSTKFDGKNYPMWEFHFRIFVQGKDLFGMLDGSRTDPNKDKEKQVWHANNARVISWILNSVHANVALSLRPFNLASKMWKHFKKNTSRKTKTFRDYSGLMAIWSEQDQSFGGNLSSTGLKEVMLEKKKTRVVQFLMKLRPDFEPIRANILNRETLPDIDVVFGELVREETQMNTQAAMDSSYTVDTAMYASKVNSTLRIHFKSLDHNALSAKSMVILHHIARREIYVFIARSLAI
ncbi:uncharacterized protein LOC132612709 [Lycium barbarum]|uniref:uncharacterized protein LOC132612709 n=1 Tax=Lycium barbarum TaxID=112863 RepID=UPI00293EE213|nr:uncharacterized protein LOC132612709 [Lycium barbarum]